MSVYMKNKRYYSTNISPRDKSEDISPISKREKVLNSLYQELISARESGNKKAIKKIEEAIEEMVPYPMRKR